MRKLRLSTIYSQRDPRWKDKMLGHNAAGTKYTLGNFGCLVTAVDAYLNALGINITVDELNDKLKQNNGFINGGLFVFNSLKNIWADIQADYISPKWNGPVPDADIKKMRDLLDQGKPLVTEVDFYPNTVDEDMHWVLVYGYDDNGDFLIFDPWTGTLVPLSVYGDPKRVIYCYRTYNKTLQFDNIEEVVCHPKSTNEKLIHNSSAWDETVHYLEIQSHPKDTPFETVRSIIGGIKSRLTDLTNKLDTANAEVTNRTEQVGRLKDQVTGEEKLRKEATDALNKALTANKEVAGVYEGQLKTKQAVIDEYAKAKGELAIENQQLKTKLGNAQTDAVKNMTNSELLGIVFKRLTPWITAIIDALPSKKS